MKGQTAQLEITVSPDMEAQFGGQLVHPLYSTSALVHHMEWAARKTILPYLEAHEEGMGSHVEVSHLMLTPTGMNITIKATVSDIRDHRIECEVEAFNCRGKVARGTIVQTVVEKKWLEQKVREFSVINGIASAQMNCAPTV
jgi:fluoroacetyl-CoA thioesterase